MNGRTQERIEMTIATIDEARLRLVDLVDLPVPGPGKALEPQTKRPLLVRPAVLPGRIGRVSECAAQ